MADETPNVEEQEDAGTPAAEEAPRRRGRGASAQQPAEGAGSATEKPKRLRRPAARKAEAAAGGEAEEKPKSRLPRGRAKAAASDAAPSQESTSAAAPSRARGIRGRSAKAAEGAVAADAGEAPTAKPARAGRGRGEAGRRRALGAPARAGSRARVLAAHADPRAGRLRSRSLRALLGAQGAHRLRPHPRQVGAGGPRDPRVRPARRRQGLVEAARSAVANAEHNHELIGDELLVKEVFADVGPTLKRFRPRAMGRATPINKRTSHLSITLAPKE